MTANDFDAALRQQEASLLPCDWSGCSAPSPKMTLEPAGFGLPQTWWKITCSSCEFAVQAARLERVIASWNQGKSK